LDIESDQTHGYYQIACYSAAGNARKENQDACAVPSVETDCQRLGALIVLADGVGGFPGGAAASSEAVHYLQALYYAEVGNEHPGDRLRECVEAVNAINRNGVMRDPVGIKGLTTLVAAVLRPDEIWIANVGDSRAYMIQSQGKDRIRLTEDHVTNNVNQAPELVGARAFPENPTDQPRITRAIGLQDRCQVDIYRYAWQPGDYLVLCSDGLGVIESSTMVKILQENPASQAARLLVEAAVAADGSDNSTAVVAALRRENEDLQTGFEEREEPPTGPLSPIPDAHPDPVDASVRPTRSWIQPSEAKLAWLVGGLLIGWLSALVLFYLY
jgi:protein phosphatase